MLFLGCFGHWSRRSKSVRVDDGSRVRTYCRLAVAVRVMVSVLGHRSMADATYFRGCGRVPGVATETAGNERFSMVVVVDEPATSASPDWKMASVQRGHTCKSVYIRSSRCLALSNTYAAEKQSNMCRNACLRLFELG